MDKWRLILSGPQPGAINMATDQALWESFRSYHQPFVRFYLWTPACLSLGRFQNLTTGLNGTILPGIPRVRRMTGGGAIWHDHELTYSLGCTQESLGIQGVKASFEKLTQFLIKTWQGLGASAGYAKDLETSAPLGTVSAACFAGKEEYDILVNGRKLGGNAQARSRNQIFQHGSIPLSLDREFLASLFLPGHAPTQEDTTSLTEEGLDISFSSLQEKLILNLEESLGVEFTHSPLTDGESLRVEELKEHFREESFWLSSGKGKLRD